MRLSQSAGFVLPQAYLDFLRTSNGGEGELPVDLLWFVIRPADKVIEWNRACPIAELGFFGFCDNGSGEMLVFDTTMSGS